LVPIAEETKDELNILQWLLSGYVLVWAAFVVPAGRLADIYGKKLALMTGLVLFMLGSAITGVGHQAWLLIFGRILQGLGAAIFSAPAFGLIFTSVPTSKQGMAMGFVGASSGLGLAAGPSLAGWIIKEAGWRWLFYINIPLCLLVMVALILYAPQEKSSESSPKIDWLSVVFLASGLGSFMFSLNQIEIWGIQDVRLWAMGLFGLLMLLVFALRDRKQKTRTMPKTLLQNKPFMSAVAASFIGSYCFALVLVMMGLYLQNTLRLSSNEAGHVFLAMTLAVGILSPVGGKLADHMDMRIPSISGSLITFLALFYLSFLGVNSSLTVVVVGMFLAGLGLGIGFPSVNTAMFRTLTPQEINTGSAIYTMAMMLGNSVSVILSTSLLVMSARPKLSSLLLNEGYRINAEEHNQLTNILGQVEHTKEQLQGFPDQQIPKLLSLIDHAFLHGFSITLWIGMALSTLAAWILFRYLKNIPLQQHHETNAVVMP
jgi:EmrB/QacA subfamily drug resistance transporter